MKKLKRCDNRETFFLPCTFIGLSKQRSYLIRFSGDGVRTEHKSPLPPYVESNFDLGPNAPNGRERGQNHRDAYTLKTETVLTLFNSQAKTTLCFAEATNALSFLLYFSHCCM